MREGQFDVLAKHLSEVKNARRKKAP